MLKRVGVLAVVAMSLSACVTGNASFKNAKLYPNDKRSETVPGLLAKPEGKGPFPAIVLLTTCGGMTFHVTADWPNFLNGLGYVALTADSLGARGYSKCTRQNFMAKNYHGITKDAYGALDYLAAQPFVDKTKIAVMGFSMGAAAINNELVPRRFREKSGLDFKAAIGMYGYCYTMRTGSIPLMEILAEKDDLATACLTNAKGESGIEVHVIPGAHHAFDAREGSGTEDAYGHYMLYDANATVKAKEFIKAFLKKHFGE